MTVGHMILWLWTAVGIVLFVAAMLRAVVLGGMQGRGRQTVDPKKFAGFPVPVVIVFWPIVLGIVGVRSRRAAS